MSRRGTGLASAIAVVGVTFGFARYAFGLFVPQISDAFGLGPGAIGAIASGSYAAYLVATTASGALTARLGSARLVALGGGASALGMAVVSVARSPAVLAVGVALAGSGSGFVWPALAQAVAHAAEGPERTRRLGAVNSGTSYAVAVAGPVALIAGSRWRPAWAAFAVAAAAVTVWAVRSLPPGRARAAAAAADAAEALRLVSRRSLPLLALAPAIGFSTAAYWTFGVDLVSEGSDDARGAVFLTVVGAAGVAGGGVGALVNRVGLRSALALTQAGIATATALLPLAPHSWAAVLPSGLLFGGTFIAAAGAAAIWAVAVYPSRAAAGVAAMTLLFTLGAVAGSVGFGLLADARGLRTTFVVAAASTVLTLAPAALAPRRGRA